MKVSLPIACDMSVFTAEERAAHGSLSTELFLRLARSVRELQDGYAFQFEHDPQLFRKLAEWVLVEQKCCPFFTFVLELEPTGGLIWLRVTGPAGAKVLIGNELSARGIASATRTSPAGTSTAAPGVGGMRAKSPSSVT